eukprot:gene19271-25911_t
MVMDDEQKAIIACVIAIRLMDGSPEIRDRFDDLNGHSLSMRLLERHQDLVAVLSAVAALGAAAELKDEANKEKLTEAGFGESMIAILRTTTEKEAHRGAAQIPMGSYPDCAMVRALLVLVPTNTPRSVLRPRATSGAPTKCDLISISYVAGLAVLLYFTNSTA